MTTHGRGAQPRDAALDERPQEPRRPQADRGVEDAEDSDVRTRPSCGTRKSGNSSEATSAPT